MNPYTFILLAHSATLMSPTAASKKRTDKVSVQFTAPGATAAMVYGKYKAADYRQTSIEQLAGAIYTPEEFTPEQAFIAAGIDWEVDKRPGAYFGAAGPEMTDKYCSIVRQDTDELLGIHRPGWTPTQNSEILHLFDHLQDKVKIENILQIRGGEKIYITAKVGQESLIAGESILRRYIHVYNSFDGSTGYGVFFTDTNLFCANQMHYMCNKAMRKAVKDGEGMSHRHTTSVTAFAEKLPMIIDVQNANFAKEVEQYRAMTSVKVSKALFGELFDKVYADKLAVPIKDKRSEDPKALRPRQRTDLKEFAAISSHFYGDTGILSNPQETLWDLFNCYTQHQTHDVGRNSKTLEGARRGVERLWGGSGAVHINHVREVCLEYV